MGKENDIGRPELYGPGKNSTELSPEEFRHATEGGQSWCVRVISAKGVPKKDLLSESDPYVALSIVDEKGEPVNPLQVVTALPHQDDPNPFWNSFRILSTSHLANPCFLRVDMYDYDATDSDDHTGFATFDLKALGDFKPATQPVSKDDKKVIHKSSKEPCTISLQLWPAPQESVKWIFMIRHGESKWNEAQRSVNVLNMMKTVDHPLNGTGVQQAQKLQQDWSNYDSEGGDAFDCEFFKVRTTYCSPLTRAVETALVSLEAHPSLAEGITLLRNLREAKNLGGQDTVGKHIGSKIEPHVYSELLSAGEKLPDQRIISLAQQKAVRMVHNDCGGVGRWWNVATEVESEEDVNERLNDVALYLGCQAERSAILVGHSLYFRDLVRQWLRDDSGLKITNPALAEQLYNEKLANAACLGLKIDFSKIDRPCILDAKLMFGSGTVQ
mmetsp:Transcript_35705/g.60178  ORF Transcript_35705/g.60178 Transcript_35705/m.60178 type:complete len:442 (+) Transcript_35705:190-1515(+)|eukprot:CAMPEP_0198210830 /NCGR_PEP_ID=MMETSP1445-20131203/22463_1 /TAXON_ID=36898 /ORGANISM="Pyramimonas sp., Strain CCMP2087" /LENGTH=441 /DNA_ID=CAMNT_0043884985 /DNA_START=165 /DNA_END=1490 /DNA_ORIENTATION=+